MSQITKTIGIILFRTNESKTEYLLLHHRGPYWNFPKGRQEKGETELETAFRETQEETGIKKDDIKIINGFQTDFEYSFSSKFKEDYGQPVTKQAIFYLGSCIAQKVQISHEHIGFGWFEYEQAHKKLFYKNGQRVLQQAHRFLLKNLKN